MLFDQRYELAASTHSISLFARGLLAMEKTLVGVIEVDARQLLEQGIRTELQRQFSEIFDKFFVFGDKNSTSQRLCNRLKVAEQALKGFQKSFEYIQDYLGIYAATIWQTEMSAMIRNDVEMELNRLHSAQSPHHLHSITEPTPLPSMQQSFTGRILHELIAVTGVSRTTYVVSFQSWYDFKSKEIVASKSLFKLLLDTFGPEALKAIHHLLQTLIKRDLQQLNTHLISFFQKHHEDLQFLRDAVEPTLRIPSDYTKLYSNAPARILKSVNLFCPLNLYACRLGQLHLLEKSLSSELRSQCSADAVPLVDALDSLNHHAVRFFQLSGAQTMQIDRFSPLLQAVEPLQDLCGMSRQRENFYHQILLESCEGDETAAAHFKRHLPILLFLYILALLSKASIQSPSGFGSLF